LPLSRFSMPCSGNENPVCAICLDPFKDGDQLRNLNCSHCFHRECVDIWLLGSRSDDLAVNGTCPTCRQNAASSPKKKTPLRIVSQQPLLLLTAGPVSSTALAPSEDASTRDIQQLAEQSSIADTCTLARSGSHSSSEASLGIDIPEYTFLQIGAFLAEGEVTSPYLMYCDQSESSRGFVGDVSDYALSPASSLCDPGAAGSSSWVMLLSGDEARSSSDSLASLDSAVSQEQ
jgi:hypothetical protein